MMKLEKILIGIGLATAITTAITLNCVDYFDTMERLKRTERWWVVEEETKVRNEFLEFKNIYNPLKIGYRMALEDYLKDCEDTKNGNTLSSVGVI